MEIQLRDPDNKVIHMFDAGQPVATTEDGKQWKLLSIKRADEMVTLKFGLIE